MFQGQSELKKKLKKTEPSKKKFFLMLFLVLVIEIYFG